MSPQVIFVISVNNICAHHFCFNGLCSFNKISWSLGTPAMTSRGCLESDFETVADFLLEAVYIAKSVQQQENFKSQMAFSNCLHSNKDFIKLRTRVEAFASQFAMPGFDF